MTKLKTLFARVPAPVKDEAKHVALTFVVAFAASAGPLLPELLHTPSKAATKALVIAAVAAGAKAAIPVAKAAAGRLFAALFTIDSEAR